MYKLEHVSKTFVSKHQSVEALKDVNITINQGDIFGIIGYSGAGKSTLIRCLNLLEKPDKGNVYFQDKNLVHLSKEELRKERKKIGMIFQHFNLLNARTVFENVEFPLKMDGVDTVIRREKVEKLLDLVGISDKRNEYPSRLSGGQKQRVAIARALASDPDVLLCDEATSALDPRTTESILTLLDQLNKELGLTIILITHQMDVIKSICRSVAVMEDGEIKEVNSIYNIFAHPKTNITKAFLASASSVHKAYLQILSNEIQTGISEKGQVWKLGFSDESADTPLISVLTRMFDLNINILYGDIEELQGVSIGTLIVGVEGEQLEMDTALNYIREHKVDVEVIQNASCD